MERNPHFIVFPNNDRFGERERIGSSDTLLVVYITHYCMSVTKYASYANKILGDSRRFRFRKLRTTDGARSLSVLRNRRDLLAQ